MKDATSLSTRDQALLKQAVELDHEDPFQVDQVGFSASLFASLSLPYKEPKAGLPSWVRRNGDLSLIVRPAVVGVSDDDEVRFGYPFGVIPRVLLCWIATEAVRTQDPHLDMGSSLSVWMKEMGLARTGESIRRLRDQVQRLSGASITVVDARLESAGHVAQQTVQVASRFDLWWNPNEDPSQGELFDHGRRNELVLTQEFFQSVIKNPVPIDMRAIAGLRTRGGGGQAVDIYLWLAHRMSYLQASTRVSWTQLKTQFGASFTRTRDFKASFLNSLNSVRRVYPRVNVIPTDHGLILRPSPTPIAKRQTRMAQKTLGAS